MKKIGNRQQAILKCLWKHGAWYRGCGWTWSYTSETERVLESLANRGLVHAIVDYRAEYHLTEAGADVVLRDRLAAWDKARAARTVSAYAYNQMTQHIAEQLNNRLRQAARRAA
jgi:hypothetical protein